MICNFYPPEKPGRFIFYNGVQSTTTIALTNDAYRKLIMVKAMANITDCSIEELNKMLLYLFEGSGQPFVADIGQMTMIYVFPFDLSPSERSIIVDASVIPRPSGVQVHFLSYDFDGTFGFYEGDWEPFDQGIFFTSNQFM